jgi:hypothetical protein
MPHRLVIPALPGGSSSGAQSETKIDAPTLTAIRIVYGVGSTRDAAPSAADFKPTYAVEIPIFSLGGLDPDGVYEFDAGALLSTIQSRAERRRWGARVELELQQSSAAVSASDVVVTGPSEAAGDLSLIGPARGSTTEGGGRRLVVGSPVIGDPAALTGFSGTWTIAAGDAPPRQVTLALSRFEFEG